MVDERGIPGFVAVEGGGRACPYPLTLHQHGVGEVHAGEGDNALMRLNRIRPHPFHEWCHPMGDPHCVSLCLYHVAHGIRRKEWVYHQRVHQEEGF